MDKKKIKEVLAEASIKTILFGIGLEVSIRLLTGEFPKGIVAIVVTTGVFIGNIIYGIYRKQK